MDPCGGGKNHEESIMYCPGALSVKLLVRIRGHGHADDHGIAEYGDGLCGWKDCNGG